MTREPNNPSSEMTLCLISNIYVFQPTKIQPIDSTGSSKSPQELCQHVHRELPDRQLPQDHHGQRNCRVHMCSCNRATEEMSKIELDSNQNWGNESQKKYRYFSDEIAAYSFYRSKFRICLFSIRRVSLNPKQKT